ncbi:hypothetical protein CYMTET_14395 [Cymbomonas tetramitiformis]|uniref:Uncharacterized protein n=1 Tax=Cymbomonas tetramitiformis TaxID=36881 RepID=A0AAE0LA78_9CHLO|nr:hypothetical protein CYMTET_14395 [Cymbomonas tetramitiformis]
MLVFRQNNASFDAYAPDGGSNAQLATQPLTADEIEPPSTVDPSSRRRSCQAQYEFEDFNLPLLGEASIMGRAISIVNSAGLYVACTNIIIESSSPSTQPLELQGLSSASGIYVL